MWHSNLCVIRGIIASGKLALSAAPLGETTLFAACRAFSSSHNSYHLDVKEKFQETHLNSLQSQD